MRCLLALLLAGCGAKLVHTDPPPPANHEQPPPVTTTTPPAIDEARETAELAAAVADLETRTGEAIRAAKAAQSESDKQAAIDKLERLKLEKVELDRRLVDLERREAIKRLEKLRKEKAELDRRLEEERQRCKDNPLAKGCS